MKSRTEVVRLLSIEIYDDNIMVIQYNGKKEVRKIKNPLALLPMLFSLLVAIIGSEEVKKIETWLDHVWVKRIKRGQSD